MHVTMSSSTTVNDITIPRVERPIGARSMKQHIFSVAQFVAIVVQFGLIVVALDFWQLESQLLARVMWLAFAGFIIHHLLPVRFRLPFFAMLSLVAVITAVGHFGPNVIASWMHGKITLNGLLYHFVPGVTLVGIGLGLIGLCHLPIRFGARVGLVANRRRWARLLAGA